MKLWLKILIIALVALIALGVGFYLFSEGYFAELEWETVAMIGAGAAGPVKFIVDSYSSKKEDEEKEKKEAIQKLHEEHLQRTEIIKHKLALSEQRGKELSTSLELLDTRLELMKERNK